METVGQILRAEREKQNLTVKDVERETSIRALYITSIEEDKYKVIPGEVYLKGFIRNYANFLGLNGPELVNLYRESQQPEEPVALEKPAAPPTTLPTENQSIAFKVPPKAAAAAILVVAALGIGVWAYQGSSKAPGSAPETKVQQQQAAVPSPSAAPAAPEKQPQAKPVMVQAKYTAECWTQVMADGKQIYEGTPKVNESFTWEAEKTISIKAGNAAAVDVTINGEPQGKLGNKGEVVVKTFTPTGAKK